MTLQSFYCFLLDNPTAIIGLLGAIVATVGIKAQRKTSREKNALDFQSEYSSDKKISDAHISIQRNLSSYTSSEISDLYKNKTDEMRTNVILILNIWEKAANAIHHGVYDEKFLYQAYGSSVLSIYIKLLPFIKAVQKDNPRTFLCLTRLVSIWQLRRAKEKSTAKKLQLEQNDLQNAIYNLNHYLQRQNLDIKAHNLKTQYRLVQGLTYGFKKQYKKMYKNHK